MLNDILQVPVDKQLWFIALFAWTLLWKGIALWKAAQKGSKPWFIVFLLINTLGILEILYVYVLSKPRAEKKAE